jgi:hypothetical protein
VRKIVADDLELVKTGIEAATTAALKPIAGLIQSIFGPAAEEAGLMLKDHVRIFRAERQLRLYRRTDAILKKAGIRPQRVPLKLLFPIIENASIEENDELQDRWANLLAHAADSNDAGSVNLSFPSMLRELSPRNVRFLDALYDEASKRIQGFPRKDIESVNFAWRDLLSVFTDARLARYPTPGIFTYAEAERDDVKADQQEVGVALDTFARHAIIEREYEIPVRRSRPPELDSGYQFTSLGARFVEACREPKRRSDTVIEIA